MTRTRRAARPALLIVLVHAACAVQGIVPATVPLDDAFRVDGALGGATVRMFLDTGADFVVVATAAAERCGIPLRPAVVKVIDSTGAERIVDSSIEFELHVGATTYVGTAPCLPLPPAVGDGLIGMNVLERGAWLFDAPQGVVHVVPGGDAEQLVAAQGYRVTDRLSLGSSGSPMVTLRLDDEHDVTVLLDTGADRTSLPIDVVDALALPAAELPEQQMAKQIAELAEEMRRLGADVEIPVGGNIGLHGVPEQRSGHRLRRLALGGRAFEQLLVTSNRRGGWLGRDVLARIPWLLHGPRRELWLLDKA